MNQATPTPQAGAHEQFASRWGFLFAAIGSAVGLGNIWRFPFIAGENGGGAFVLLYLLFIVVLGVPALIAMIMIGRRGRQSPINSTHVLAVAEGRSPKWKYLGWLTVIAAYMALTFFSVVAGWTLDYLVMSARGLFDGIGPEASKQVFEAVKGDPLRMGFWHGLFMAFTIFIVARGVREGVEKAVKFMMPALFIILVMLVAYGAFTADMGAALRFLFAPDFSKIDNNAVLQALGQAFFSLSVGGGGIIAYGAYMQKDTSIASASAVIAGADTLVALLAGLAIFSIVLANGLEPAGGPGLIFVTLPIAFGHMPGGLFFGTLFFVLVFFAALSTSISMLESLVSWLEERKGLKRPAMALASGGFAWLIGLGSVLSFNIWNDVKPLAMFKTFETMTIFRLFDFFTANVAIPVSGLLITVFIGWVISPDTSRDELNMRRPWTFSAWYFIMRYLAPAALLTIFIAKLVSD